MAYTYTPDQTKETRDFYMELAKPLGGLTALCKRIELPYISWYSAIRRRSGLPPRQAEYLCELILSNSDYPNVGRDDVLRICFGDDAWQLIREDDYRTLQGTRSFWEWWEDKNGMKKDKYGQIGVHPSQIWHFTSGYFRKFSPRTAFQIAKRSGYEIELFHLIGVDRAVVASVCPIQRAIMPSLRELHTAA